MDDAERDRDSSDTDGYPSPTGVDNVLDPMSLVLAGTSALHPQHPSMNSPEATSVTSLSFSTVDEVVHEEEEEEEGAPSDEEKEHGSTRSTESTAASSVSTLEVSPILSLSEDVPVTSSVSTRRAR